MVDSHDAKCLVQRLRNPKRLQAAGHIPWDVQLVLVHAQRSMQNHCPSCDCTAATHHTAHRRFTDGSGGGGGNAKRHSQVGEDTLKGTSIRHTHIALAVSTSIATLRPFPCGCILARICCCCCCCCPKFPHCRP